MIAVGETDPTAAEVPFELPLDIDPLTGLTGHVFVLGEVRMRLPGALGWVDVDPVQIVEKGYGRFAIQLTAVQCANPGEVLYAAVVAGCQPDRGRETIGAGGDIALNTAGWIWFYLADAVDPVNGAPVTGHVFAPGEVRLCLPAAAYADANVAGIAEWGEGLYALRLSPGAGDTIRRGKAYLYADVPGAQRFETYVTIFGTVVAPTVPATPPPTPANSAAFGTVLATVDHVAVAIARLPQQFRGFS
jgi:hypothetical protein